jgi:hypothetical protein
MNCWQKRYHQLYSQSKSQFDSHVIELITAKENFICDSPYTNPLLKYDFSGASIRRYKSGKIRILYALSVEAVNLWDGKPEAPEVIFLYVDLRRDETYSEALKALRRHDVL